MTLPGFLFTCPDLLHRQKYLPLSLYTIPSTTTTTTTCLTHSCIFFYFISHLLCHLYDLNTFYVLLHFIHHGLYSPPQLHSLPPPSPPLLPFYSLPALLLSLSAHTHSDSLYLLLSPPHTSSSNHTNRLHYLSDLDALHLVQPFLRKFSVFTSSFFTSRLKRLRFNSYLRCPQPDLLTSQLHHHRFQYTVTSLTYTRVIFTSFSLSTITFSFSAFTYFAFPTCTLLHVPFPSYIPPVPRPFHVSSPFQYTSTS